MSKWPHERGAVDETVFVPLSPYGRGVEPPGRQGNEAPDVGLFGRPRLDPERYRPVRPTRARDAARPTLRVLEPDRSVVAAQAAFGQVYREVEQTVVSLGARVERSVEEVRWCTGQAG